MPLVDFSCQNGVTTKNGTNCTQSMPSPYKIHINIFTRIHHRTNPANKHILPPSIIQLIKAKFLKKKVSIIEMGNAQLELTKQQSRRRSISHSLPENISTKVELASTVKHIHDHKKIIFGKINKLLKSNEKFNTTGKMGAQLMHTRHSMHNEITHLSSVNAARKEVDYFDSILDTLHKRMKLNSNANQIKPCENITPKGNILFVNNAILTKFTLPKTNREASTMDRASELMKIERINPITRNETYHPSITRSMVNTPLKPIVTKKIKRNVIEDMQDCDISPWNY